MKAFYRYEDGLYQPLQPATGPWTKQHQNGTSVGGLLAHEIEKVPTAAPLRLVRVTVELQRAVPLAPTEACVRIIRDGKRVQLVEARLLVDGETYASALGLRVCEGDGPVMTPPAHGFPDPEAAPRVPLTRVLGEGHPMQTRIVKGGRAEPGPGAYWTLFNADLVAGEPTSATIRAVMAADIASGVSTVVSRNWASPNVDLSLYLARAPRGDWIFTQAETEQYGEGFALVSSVLSDGDGAFAYGHQTLLYSQAGGARSSSGSGQ